MTRTAVLCACLALAGAASAQQGTRGPTERQAQRAPLAMENLEPAVDVGAAARRAAPGAAAAAAASSSAGTPSAASPSAAATLAANAAPRSQAPAGRVMDSLDLGTTSITGNQELPKVLYIVPWKKSDLGELVGRPVNTLLDEVLAPVDPEVFERHLDYYESLHRDSEEE